MFNAHRYLRDRRIQTWLAGKNVSPDNIGIRCPLCNDPSNHGSFFPDGGYACWRCGWHPVEDVIIALEKCQPHEAYRILLDYETDHGYLPVLKHQPKALGLQGKLDWPPGTLPLQSPHKAYLRGRGFDPDFLEAKYGLRGAGPAGIYAWRIITPIFWNGQFVSYQGRDITGRAKIKYLSCKPEFELYPHKHLLYNIDNAREMGIIVEGTFDVWRLGDGAVATIGSTTTKQQTILAAERFRKVFLLFDSEKPAQAKAKKMGDMLSVLGVEAVNIMLAHGDPADMSQEESNELKQSLLRE